MKKILYVIVFIISLCLPAAAQEDILTRAVSDVTVRGAEVLSRSDIEKLVTLNIVPGQFVTIPGLEEDLKSIYGTGFFQSVSVNIMNKGAGVIIEYLVSENPKVAGIVISGNISFTADYLARSLKTKVGYPLNYRYIEQDIERIDRLYRSAGYELSRVSDMFFDKDRGLIFIRISEPCVGHISLSGYDRVRPKLLEREITTTPGSVFNSTLLRKDRERLLRTGLLGNVSSPRLSASPTPGEVLVHFDVTERKTNQLNFGYGISSREQFSFVKLTLLNFFEWGETMTLRVQNGYELGLEKQTYFFRFYTPWIFEQRRSFAYERYLKIRSENLVQNGLVTDTLEISRDGWGAELGLLEEDPIYISTEYYEEYVSETQAAPDIAYSKKSIALVNIYNTVKRDKFNNESEGEYGKLRLESGGLLGNLLGSEIDLGGRTFGRYELMYSRFLTLYPSHIAAVHFESGIYNVDGEETILEGEQYTAGGSTTVRGYLDIYPFAVGTRRIILNTEYRLAFNEWFQLVFFYDWGNAFNLGPIYTADFMSGRGIGVRFGTPLGPLRFDWAFGDDYTDIFGNEHTSARMPRNILHFSLGQTF